MRSLLLSPFAVRWKEETTISLALSHLMPKKENPSKWNDASSRSSWVFKVCGGVTAYRQPGLFTPHRYANAAIIKQSAVPFRLFIPAECVNSATRAWTFICAVSSAQFVQRTIFAGPLEPPAVWSNQRRAALIAWPQQEARWSGTGHYPPGERSPPGPLIVHPRLLYFPSPPASAGRLEVELQSLKVEKKVTAATWPTSSLRAFIWKDPLI